TKNSVILIEEGNASNRCIGLAFGGSEYSASHSELFERIESGLGVDSSLRNVELATAACSIGVIIPCCSDGTFLVKECSSEFCRHAVTWSAHAERNTGCSSFAVRVARLDHEAVDHTVKEYAVVKTNLHQFEKIITMQWSRIGEAKHHVSVIRLDQYISLSVFFLNCGILL